MDIKYAIGLRIKSLRLIKSISQQQLASLTGLNRSFLSHIESGERNISTETLIKLTNGINVSLRVFFDDDAFN